MASALIIPTGDAPKVSSPVNPPSTGMVGTDPSSYGADIGAELRRAGLQVGGDLIQHQQQANEERINYEMGQILNWRRDNVDDPEKGAKYVKGPEAKQAAEDALKRFQDFTDQRMETLASPEQRDLYAQRVLAQRSVLTNELDNHVGQELHTAAAQGLEGAATLAQSNGANAISRANAGDPTGYGDYLQAKKDNEAAARNKIIFMGIRDFASPEAKSIMAQSATDFHSGVLTELGRDRAQAAAVYLAANRNDMLGGAAAKWHEQIQTWQRENDHMRGLNEAASLGEMLYQQFGNNPTAVNGYIRDRIGAIKDPIEQQRFLAVAGAAREHWAGTVARQDQIRKTAQGNLYEGLVNEVINQYNGDYTAAMSNPGFVNRVISLPGTSQLSLKQAFARDANADLSQGYLALAQINSMPSGWTNTKYANQGQFMQEWFSQVGQKLWPEAVRAWETDQKNAVNPLPRDAFKAYTESALRAAVNYRRDGNPMHDTWDNANPEQLRAWVWFVGQADLLWAQHQEAIKKSPAAAADPAWMDGAVGPLIKQVESMYEKGAFRSRIPAPMISPAVEMASAVPGRPADAPIPKWDGADPATEPAKGQRYYGPDGKLHIRR